MKILYVTTISNTVNAFLIPHIKMLIDEGHQVDVAFNIEQDIKPEIHEMGCKVHQLPLQRSPIKKDNLRAYKMLKKIIITESYDLVHTHTPVASALVRLACRNLNNVKVFYTAHGFHFHKGAPFLNWLVYYPIERLLARYTDVLITINKEDYSRAKKSFKAESVEYIPGVGIDTKKFSEVIIDESKKRRELGIPDYAFVVLSVGELNKNKNHKVIIAAIAKLSNSKIHYVICGQGPLENYLVNLTQELRLEKQVHLLGFRKDIPEICKVSDLFVFPSLREGLGLAALEAMASGLPIITSNVHGIVDYSIDEVTGYSCSPGDVDGFVGAMKKLINNTDLRVEIGSKNIDIAKKYGINLITNEMRKMYKRNMQ